MPHNLIFTPEAGDDIATAYAWYDDKRKGLGDEFLHCVEASIQAIIRMPELNLKIHENYRRALVRRFPSKFLSSRIWFFLCSHLLF